MTMTTTTTTTTILLLLIIATATTTTYAATNNYTFTQKVDHMNASDQRTFQQRYQVIDDNYKPGGPIFLFLAGEAPMEFFVFQTVQIRTTWASAHNALYISLEHRYYGSSFPFAINNTYSTDNLAYLSSEQALEDAAAFIRWYNTQITTPHGPWVTFGCSYSAGLAAWFRSKHSDLTIGAVAPSGPVVATLNFTSFYTQFQYSATPACAQRTRVASSMIEALANDADSLAQLGTEFGACEKVTPVDRFYFLYTLMAVVGSADQMSNPPTWGLNATCNLLSDQSVQPVQAFINAFNYQLAHPDGLAASPHPHVRAIVRRLQKSVRENNCVPFSEAQYLADMRRVDNQDRSWVWQTCVEFGYFNGGYPGTSVFFDNLPVEHIVAWCAAIYGIPNMTPNIAATNQFYGGKQLAATNVLFTNGLLDPWHLLSITEAEGGVAAVNYEAGHCGSLIEASDADPPSLIKARQVVASYLNKWLA